MSTTTTPEPDYYVAGHVHRGGAYQQQRGAFDGFLGVLDGIASVTNSVGHTVSSVADARADWAEGQAAWDDVTLNRAEREQGMLRDLLKVERGDNIQLYYALGAVAVAAILIFK